MPVTQQEQFCQCYYWRQCKWPQKKTCIHSQNIGSLVNNEACKPSISVGYLFLILTKLCALYFIIKCWRSAHRSQNCQGDWSSHIFPPLHQAVTRNTSSRPLFKHKNILKIDFLSYGNAFVSAVNRPIVSQYQMKSGQTMHFLFSSPLCSPVRVLCHLLHFSLQMLFLFTSNVTILILQCWIKNVVELSTIWRCFLSCLMLLTCTGTSRNRLRTCL